MTLSLGLASLRPADQPAPIKINKNQQVQAFSSKLIELHSGRQAMHQGQKLHVSAGSAVLGQRLIIGIGKPVTCAQLRRKADDNRAAFSRRSPKVCV